MPIYDLKVVIPRTWYMDKIRFFRSLEMICAFQSMIFRLAAVQPTFTSTLIFGRGKLERGGGSALALLHNKPVQSHLSVLSLQSCTVLSVSVQNTDARS